MSYRKGALFKVLVLSCGVSAGRAAETRAQPRLKGGDHVLHHGAENRRLKGRKTAHGDQPEGPPYFMQASTLPTIQGLCPATDLPPRGISQLTLQQHCSFTDSVVHPALSSQLIRNGIIIDVGANDGRNLALPSVVQGLGAKIISFEPQPSVAMQLLGTAAKKAARRKSRGEEPPIVHRLPVQANSAPTPDAVEEAVKLLIGSSAGGLVVVEAGAGDLVSSFPIFHAKDSGTKMTSLASSNMPKGENGGAAPPQKVATVNVFTIDSLFNASSTLRDQTVSLLKIDAQGFEAKVVKGASELLLSKSQPNLVVQFEFVPKMITGAMKVGKGPGARRKGRHPGLELLEFMRASGRMCFQVSPIDNRQDTRHSLIGFEDFTRMHMLGPCPTLGCSSELICIPHCIARVAEEGGISTDLRAQWLVKTLMSTAGCSTSTDLDNSTVMGSLVGEITGSISHFYDKTRAQAEAKAEKMPRDIEREVLRSSSILRRC